MKTFAACLTAFGLWTLTAHGQAEVIVRERAKGVANQNNARQGAQPAAPATAASPAAVPTAPPAASRPTVQQQNIAKLKADLARVRQEGKVTDKSKQGFAKDLLVTAQGSGKPSMTTLASLSEHWLAAVASKDVTAVADEKLVSKVVVLLNSGGLPTRRTQELADESQAALQSAGVSAEAAAKINADLQLIAADVERTRQQ